MQWLPEAITECLRSALQLGKQEQTCSDNAMTCSGDVIGASLQPWTASDSLMWTGVALQGTDLEVFREAGGQAAPDAISV